jgi:hypothetical protein
MRHNIGKKRLISWTKRLHKKNNLSFFLARHIFQSSNNLKRVPRINSLAPQVHVSLQYAFPFLILHNQTNQRQTVTKWNLWFIWNVGESRRSKTATSLTSLAI